MNLSPITLLNSKDLGKDKMHTVATQFVSILLSKIFDKMEESVVESSLIPQSTSEKWYRKWLMDAYSQEATSNQLKSLVDMVTSQLARGAYEK